MVGSYLNMEDQRSLSQCNKCCRAFMRNANLIRYHLKSPQWRDRYVNDVAFRHSVDSRGHVWELHVEDYDTVEDVTFLNRVYTLTRRGMRGVRDVSALSSVHTLTLEGMSGVIDVS